MDHHNCIAVILNCRLSGVTDNIHGMGEVKEEFHRLVVFHRWFWQKLRPDEIYCVGCFKTVHYNASQLFLLAGFVHLFGFRNLHNGGIQSRNIWCYPIQHILMNYSARSKPLFATRALFQGANAGRNSCWTISLIFPIIFPQPQWRLLIPSVAVSSFGTSTSEIISNSCNPPRPLKCGHYSALLVVFQWWKLNLPNGTLISLARFLRPADYVCLVFLLPLLWLSIIYALVVEIPWANWFAYPIKTDQLYNYFSSLSFLHT